MKHLTRKLLLALPLAVLAVVVSTGLAFAQTTFTFVSPQSGGDQKPHPECGRHFQLRCLGRG